MKIYRVAILGCRARGTAAAKAYHAHPRTQLVGLCDLLPERLAALGDELGVAGRFTDLDAMIEQTQPDIVAIPTGTEFHYDLCMRVLEHGVNIEVEKPLCATLEQADEVMAKAQDKGVRTAVHHQTRAGASIRAVTEALRAGRIGKLHYLTASGKGYYGGYGLMNIGTHLINSLLEFTGPCRRVAAVATTAGRPITPADVLQSPSGMGIIAGEHITATLEFDDNVTATLRQHRFAAIDANAMNIELFGETGRLLHAHHTGPWWLPTPQAVPGRSAKQWQQLPCTMPEHYGVAKDGALPIDSTAADYSFVDDFVQALDQGREHLCSGFEGRHVMEIILAIFESAAYGHVVELPQKRRDHPLLRWRHEASLGEPEPKPRAYLEWLTEEDRRLGRR
ncbi:MAG: Gfo/Idh/MocA family oxidoreductase [Caldilineaceae bacterium]|nr:Gfo/Idh/MocA family oxidoreductase [Caldilineaceae bacterium]